MNKRTHESGGARPGERSSAEYTLEEVAIARAVDKLRVDEDGLGWIRGMDPRGSEAMQQRHDDDPQATRVERATQEMFEQLRRAVVALAYATVSAVDADGNLTMDEPHREAVLLAIKPLVAGMAAGGPASGSVTNSGTPAT